VGWDEVSRDIDML